MGDGEIFSEAMKYLQAQSQNEEHTPNKFKSKPEKGEYYKLTPTSSVLKQK